MVSKKLVRTASLLGLSSLLALTPLSVLSRDISTNAPADVCIANPTNGFNLDILELEAKPDIESLKFRMLNLTEYRLENELNPANINDSLLYFAGHHPSKSHYDLFTDRANDAIQSSFKDAFFDWGKERLEYFPIPEFIKPVINDITTIPEKVHLASPSRSGEGPPGAMLQEDSKSPGRWTFHYNPFTDSDNGSLMYNPGANTLINLTLGYRRGLELITRHDIKQFGASIYAGARCEGLNMDASINDMSLRTRLDPNISTYIGLVKEKRKTDPASGLNVQTSLVNIGVRYTFNPENGKNRALFVGASYTRKF